jgi:hypothetical protein
MEKVRKEKKERGCRPPKTAFRRTDDPYASAAARSVSEQAVSRSADDPSAFSGEKRQTAEEKNEHVCWH